MKTMVIFKKFEEGDIIAIFPKQKEMDGSLVSYQHNGQHTPCSPNLLISLDAAKQYEYNYLANELFEMGYELEIVQQVN